MSTASVPNTFANAVTATGLQLDTNFNTIVAYINEPLNRNNFSTDSGTTNTIVLTFSPPVSAYSAGLEITFKAATTNTGATVINCDTLGNQNFIQPGGGALSAGQIQSGGIYLAGHNGSAFVFIGQNVLAAAKADMQTATSAVTFVSPAQTQNHPGVAKAWAVWNGTSTGTITADASYNVSVIQRLGVGTYTLGLTTVMANDQYAVAASRGNFIVNSYSTAGVNIAFFNTTGVASDFTRVSVILFGTQ